MGESEKRGRSLCVQCARQIPEQLKSFRERSPLGGTFTRECPSCGFGTVWVGRDGSARMSFQDGRSFVVDDLWGPCLECAAEIEKRAKAEGEGSWPFECKHLGRAFRVQVFAEESWAITEGEQQQ